MELLAAPYVAGPFAEGSYSITLRMDDTMLAAVKPPYADYFQGG